MNFIPFIFLVTAALASGLVWYNESPKRLSSSNLALFLFIVGMILAFVISGHPLIHVEFGG